MDHLRVLVDLSKDDGAMHLRLGGESEGMDGMPASYVIARAVGRRFPGLTICSSPPPVRNTLDAWAKSGTRSSVDINLLLDCIYWRVV